MAKEILRRPYTGQIMKAQSMFVFLTEKFETAIQFFLVEKKEVRKTSERLTNRFSAAKTIKGTRQFYSIIPVDEGHLTAHQLSRGPGKVFGIRR